MSEELRRSAGQAKSASDQAEALHRTVKARQAEHLADCERSQAGISIGDAAAVWEMIRLMQEASSIQAEAQREAGIGGMRSVGVMPSGGEVMRRAMRDLANPAEKPGRGNGVEQGPTDKQVKDLTEAITRQTDEMKRGLYVRMA